MNVSQPFGDPVSWLSISQGRAAWEEKALALFHYQANTVDIYANYLQQLNVAPERIEKVEDIPFLPIGFFKTHRVAGSASQAITFQSSGTTGSVTSKHYVQDLVYYEAAFRASFAQFYGNAADYCFLCLLPSYLERSGSSLVYMAEAFIQESKVGESGFYLDDMEAMRATLSRMESQGIPTVVLGVTYALLDFADFAGNMPLKHTVFMETGGMKGKREEWSKPRVHAHLKASFQCNIHSEFGMTELLSQCYSLSDGLFQAPPWVRMFTREVRDPFASISGRAGVLKVADLANVHSCAFIETQDLARIHANGTFELLGRVDFADMRGCNLLVD